MRSRFVAPASLLSVAFLVTGCGIGVTGNSPDVALTAGAITGKSFGGQSPIVGATINIYAVGTSGYGSDATLLATTTTDASGNFSFPANAYTCPSPSIPVYILSLGGNTGAGVNHNAVNGVGIGPCSVAPSTYVVMNEVTTVALAYSLSHFFTPTLGSASTDSFGAPASGGGYLGISNAMNNQVHHMVNINYGGVNAVPNGQIDSGKIYTIANILAACVNSTGTTSATETKTTCGKLFHYTTPTSGTRPTDTLQAAVQMALNPLQQVANLFALAPATPVFADALTYVPNDWTIAMSFTASNLGLAVDTATLSTIDIDASGRIWFPSNHAPTGSTASAVGLASFDPSNESFSGPYNGSGMLHPQQVAIDWQGLGWLNDSQSSVVSSYNTGSPSTFSTYTLANTATTAVTISADNSIEFGLNQAGTSYAVSRASRDKTSQSITGYALVPASTSANPYTSMAGDAQAGDALVADSATTTRMFNSYLAPASQGGGTTSVVNANDNNGQVIFTGNDFVSVRSYSGTGNANDGLCIFSQQTCYTLRGGLQLSPIGMAIDGDGALWLADSASASVQQVVPQSTGSNAAVYLNANNVVPNNQFVHDSNNGGALVTPYGIAIDNSGNVWVSNAGCTSNFCTPSSGFVLSEIIGAAAPTTTPVSVQIEPDVPVTGTRP